MRRFDNVCCSTSDDFSGTSTDICDVATLIRSEAIGFRYQRQAQLLPKIGSCRAELDQLLLANEPKASRKQLTLIRLFTRGADLLLLNERREG